MKDVSRSMDYLDYINPHKNTSNKIGYDLWFEMSYGRNSLWNFFHIHRFRLSDRKKYIIESLNNNYEINNR